MPLILGTNSIKDTGYEVANSLRFNDGSADYLNRTPSSGGNRRTFTFSTWVKRGNLGGKTIFSANTQSTSNGYFTIYFSGEAIRVRIYESSAKDVVTSMLFRDLSAWYHIVVAVDTTQSTSSDRVKIYVNGSEADKSSGSYTSQDFETSVNNTVIQQVGVGRDSGGSLSNYFDGYQAETVLIDGTALDPTSFGEFDADSPTIWKPIDVSGLTFGTNGFYLDFENASSLGADVSGNGNNFTVNNLTSIDQSTDTCTNNFATLNPIAFKEASDGQMSEGNLKFSSADASLHNLSMSTFSVDTGKWYWEVQLAGTINNYAYIGIRTYESLSAASKNQYLGEATGGISLRSDGYYNVDGSFPSQFSGISYGSGDIISVGLDLDNNKIYWYENGTLVNSGGTTITNRLYAPGISLVGNNGIANFNFGSPSFSISSGNSDANGHGNFEYAPPSGFFALCTKNLAEFG